MIKKPNRSQPFILFIFKSMELELGPVLDWIEELEPN
jgi:hypothetical protein